MRPIVLAFHLALLGVASSAAAQTAEPARPVPEREAARGEKAAERPARTEPVIEISRSSKTNCDVKPVMTDDEIERCRRPWSGR